MLEDWNKKDWKLEGQFCILDYDNVILGDIWRLAQ